MAFDAFYLSAVLEELRGLGEARVDKLHQPSRDMVILHLRGRERREKLLIPIPLPPGSILPPPTRKTPLSPPCSACFCGSICWAPGWWR